MRPFLACLAAVLLACAAPARAEEKMLYVEYHLIIPESPSVMTDKLIRKLWRLGTKYLRFEDVPNPESKQHALVIVAEPDLWMIDRATGRGKHALDPGPTYKVRFPMLSQETSPRLKALEFGNEMAFFKENNARELTGQSIDGVPFQAFALTMDERDLILYVRPDGRPFQVTVKSGDTQYSVRIVRYDANTTPNPKLFEPPPGVKFE